MRTPRYAFNEQKVQRYFAEGRGTGSGRSYKPWLTINDLPSLGRSHRLRGLKTDRVHHLLSDGEWKTFLRFEADPDVLDIREQFPLNRLETYRAARALNVAHPVTLSGTPYVLTVDFLLTRQGHGGVTYQGYSFKYEPDTLKPRDWELHRIMETALSKHGVSLVMADEKSFNDAFERNFDSIRSCWDLTNFAWYDWGTASTYAEFLERAIRDNSPATLGEACVEIAAGLRGGKANEVIAVAKHLLARGHLVADISSIEDLTKLLLSDIKVAVEII